MGKTVIVVADHPGFWVNRILSPYLNEAAILLSEGVPVEVIDRAMTALGLPGRPGRAARRGRARRGAEGRRRDARGVRRPAPAARDARAAARPTAGLGRKNGRGFYRYHDGHKAGVDDYGLRPARRPAGRGRRCRVVERRLVHAMLNEAAMALDEGAVRSSRDGDVGALFGIGFPAFRGGPLRMIDDLTATQVAGRAARPRGRARRRASRPPSA